MKNLNKENIKFNILDRLFIAMILGQTFMYAESNNLAKIFDNARKIIDSTLMTSIATLVLIICAGSLMFGNVEKFKVQLWSVIGGLALIYSATYIASTIYGK
jgi:type IV secretory pathway VirB2 component (pilin)